jgi:regulator of protease activity HflC (stomatin/prohibitin superfamily)
MKKFLPFFTALLFMFMFSITACSRIGVGEAGIVVSMAGSSRGVADIPVRTGWVFYNPIAASVIAYPTFVQTAVWTHSLEEGNPVDESITFNSKDGLLFNADVHLSYHLEQAKIPYFYVKYKSDKISEFTHGIMRQTARDEFNNVASKYLAEDIYGIKKEAFVTEVKTRLNNEFKDTGLVIESLGFVGAPRPPQQFVDAINSKLSATQNAIKAENELREAEAQAKKQVAKAEGEAKSNQALASSLTPALLQWRSYDLQEKAISKWSGKLPEYMGNGPTPFLDVTKK